MLFPKSRALFGEGIFSMPERILLLGIATVALAALLVAPRLASADVVVIHNATGEPVSFKLGPAEKAAAYQLNAGELRALPTIGRVRLEYLPRRGEPAAYLLGPNTCYRFSLATDSRLTFYQLGLRESPQTAAGTGIAKADQFDSVTTIPVKVLVDDNEPATETVWQTRLQNRIDAASRILQRECRLRLKVVALGRWFSDNDTKDFAASTAEFAREVELQPAVLAIGFTSQYALPEEPSHFGSIPRPLGTHILIRERSRKMSEAERLEGLLHSLGHWLGATHSDEPNSVMRELLGDRKARNAEFPIHFDPRNLLAINLTSEEIRMNGALESRAYSRLTLLRLREIHGLDAQPRKEPAATSTGQETALVQSDDPRITSEPRPRRPGAAESEHGAAGEDSDKPEDDTDDPGAEDKIVNLLGRWKTVSAERNGKTYQTGVGLKPLLTDKHVTIRAKDIGTVRLQFRLLRPLPPTKDHPAPYPRVNLVLEVQGHKLVSKGIYKLDGDTLTACCAEPGDPRPTDFTTNRDDGHALLVLKRVP